MERRDFLAITFATPLILSSCSEPKKLLGNITELKNRETFHEFNGNSIYVYFVNEEFKIINLTCTHKKCTVKKNGETWICPCHKGKFSANGKKMEGKPPRDLYLYDYVITNNELWVLNQFKNP